MSALDDLPPLREVIRRHDLSARKSLGQNFLLDLNLTARIARASGELEGTIVVEIGPGPGGLTRALLALGAKRVIAVEKDSRAVAALSEIAQHYPGRLDIIEGDALKTDFPALLGGAPARIVANQGDDAYGRLGVLAGWRTKARILFDVPPSAFVPPPKITSSVVHLVPREEPLPCPVRALEAVTQAAFGQRRKMLRQSLKGVFRDPSATLESVGVAPTARAEEVGIAGFAALAQALDAERRA